MIDFVNFRSVSMANVGHFRPQNSICLGFEMSSFSFPVFDLLVFFSFYRFFPEDFPFSIFPGLELTRSGIVFWSFSWIPQNWQRWTRCWPQWQGGGLGWFQPPILGISPPHDRWEGNRAEKWEGEVGLAVPTRAKIHHLASLENPWRIHRHRWWVARLSDAINRSFIESLRYR